MPLTSGGRSFIGAICMPISQTGRCLLVTGAAGYIGARLVAKASHAGWRVKAAVRSPRDGPPLPGIELRRYDLGATENLDALLDGVDSVVHLAVLLQETVAAQDSEEQNVEGTRRLLEAARSHGVRRFLVASSQSAAPDSPSAYGRSKWRVEQLLTGDGEAAVRLGMVTGGPLRGVFGQLVRICKRYPVVPVVRPGAPVYPVHLDDVCAALLDLAGRDEAPRRLVELGPANPITFARYLRLLSERRLGRRALHLRIPLWTALLLSTLSERLPGLPRISRERLLGLKALQRRPQGLADGGSPVDLRDVGDALAEEGRRRRLAAEGSTLMTYVLRRRVRASVVRRYVRALNGAAPLDLPAAVRAWPRLVRVLEPLPGRGSGHTVSARLGLAARVAEMTPEGARRFHDYRGSLRAIALLRIGAILLVEAMLMPARIFAAFRKRS